MAISMLKCFCFLYCYVSLSVLMFGDLPHYLCHTAQSTNPFVAAGVAPAAAPTNPFQSNGRAANTAVAAAAAAAAGMFVNV